jgi:hypothetical protein
VRAGWQQFLDERFENGVEWARWALDRWAAFPVTADPRPLVLVGPRVVTEGFKTTEAKRAFIEGRVVCSPTVPGNVSAQFHGGAATADRSGGGALLLISAARVDFTEFLTDRGPCRLPAWRLSADDALGPIWMLDPMVEDWQPSADAAGPPPNGQAPARDPVMRIEIDDDDRTVTVDWLGAPPEYETYPTAQAIETEHAVAFIARGVTSSWTGVRRAVGASCTTFPRDSANRSAHASSLTSTATRAPRSQPAPPAD